MEIKDLASDWDRLEWLAVLCGAAFFSGIILAYTGVYYSEIIFVIGHTFDKVMHAIKLFPL